MRSLAVYHHLVLFILPVSGQILGSDIVPGFVPDLPHRLVYAIGPVIKNSAGDVLSTGQVQLPVRFECWSTEPTADVNLDGFVTGDDSDLFRKWFEMGDMKADFDQDGFLTGEDFDSFQEVFIRGV